MLSNMSRPKIWVNGCFDILHIGHLMLLQYASMLGVVKVGLDSDDRIKKRKGSNRPFHLLEERTKIIESIRYVDSVVSFNTDDELESHIKDWGTSIIVVGNDYTVKDVVGADTVESVVLFTKYKDFSTTKIMQYG